MPNPASSGIGYLSVASVLQRLGEAEGWKYLDALDKNIAEYTKSGSKPCKDAAAGERAVGGSFEYVALEMKKKGAPVEMVLPREGSGYEVEANALTKKGARRGCPRTSARSCTGTTSTGSRGTATASWPSGRSDTPTSLPRCRRKCAESSGAGCRRRRAERIYSEAHGRIAT